MTKIKNRILIIEREKQQKCTFCRKIKELRPYGPNGERICFKCAMKDEESTKRQFIKLLKRII